jgi:hypothetical protein
MGSFLGARGVYMPASMLDRSDERHKEGGKVGKDGKDGKDGKVFR